VILGVIVTHYTTTWQFKKKNKKSRTKNWYV